MVPGPRFEDVEVGLELPPRTYSVERRDLVRYAGASLDFNPIHWSPEAAERAGLPGVIAHGMLTMALAGRAVTDWVGDPGAVEDYSVRFSRPLVVDGVEGAAVEVRGRVGELLDGERVVVELAVTGGGRDLLTRARAVVRLSKPSSAEL